MKYLLVASFIAFSSMNMPCDASHHTKTTMTQEQKLFFRNHAEERFKKAYDLLMELFELSEFDSELSLRAGLDDHRYAFKFVMDGFKSGLVNSSMIDDLQFAQLAEKHVSVSCLHTEDPMTSQELQKCKYFLMRMEREERDEKKKVLKTIVKMRGYTKNSIPILKREIQQLYYELNVSKIFQICRQNNFYTDKVKCAQKFFELEFGYLLDPCRNECSAMTDNLIPMGSTTTESIQLLHLTLMPWLQTLPESDPARQDIERLIEDSCQITDQIQKNVLMIEVIKHA